MRKSTVEGSFLDSFAKSKSQEAIISREKWEEEKKTSIAQVQLQMKLAAEEQRQWLTLRLVEAQFAELIAEVGPNPCIK